MKELAVIILSMVGIISAHAAEMSTSPASPESNSTDSRELVAYPAEVKTYLLGNMRRHLEALSQIMDAAAKGKYAKAADIADNSLGMNSAGATSCQMDGDRHMMNMSEPVPPEHKLRHLMPDRWRELGQNMHKSANEFALMAREADRDPNKIAAASAALANITQQCVACHASFRIQ